LRRLTPVSGKVLIKKSYFNGRLVSVKPEADRCAAIAAATGLPMKQVIQEITSLQGLNSMNRHEKLDKLKVILSDAGSAVVALSGGTDSTFLVSVAAGSPVSD
jgi:hypothetical protein